MTISLGRPLVAGLTAAATALLAIPASASRAAEPPALANTGFILDGARDGLVERDAPGLTTLSVAGVSISADGKDVAAPNDGAARLATTAHDNGLRAELLVSNFSSRLGDFDSRAAARLLRHKSNIRHVAQKLAGFVEDQGWDGVNIDLESLAKADGPGLVRLIERLQARMPAEKTVSIDLQASTTAAGYRRGGYRLTEI